MNFLTADVAIIVDTSKLPQQLARAKAATTRTVSSMEKSFKRLDRSINRITSSVVRYAKLASVALLGIGIASAKMAMDAEESENLFEVSMGNMANAARAWSEELSDALYLNAYEVRKSVGTFNVMFESMGLGAKAAYDMAAGLTQLSYDMASFYNLKPAEAFQKVRSGIVGMSRPLKDLGILIDDTTVKQWAINNAFGDGTGKLSQLEKVQVRYRVLLEQTKKAQGDLERTLRSSTNVFRSLWTIIQYTATSIGTELLPMVTEYGLAMRDWLKENREDVTEWAKIWAEKIEGIIGWFIKWRKEIVITVGVVGGLAVAYTTLSTAIKATTFAYGIFAGAIGIGASFLTVAGASKVMEGMIVKAGFSAAQAAEHARTLTGRFGKLRIGITRLTPALKGLGVAALAVGAAWGAWQIKKLVGELWEWGKALDNVVETHERLGKVLERRFMPEESTIGGWTLKELQKMLPMSERLREEIEALNKAYISRTQIKERKKPFIAGIPSPPGGEEVMLYLQKQRNEEFLKEHKILADINETATENYNKMKEALQFEYNMLGEIDDVRERAIERSNVQAEIDKMIGVDRVQMMEDYISLYDKLIEKQNSFGHTLKLWANDAMATGKNLGDVLTSAFDRAADSFADMLMKQKVDWKAFGRMFIRQLLAMIIKLQMAVALKTILGFVSPTPAPASTTFANPMAVFGAPSAQHGGEITQTGLAKVHKGEVFSGVNNEKGFGGITVNNYAGDSIDVEVMDEERVVNISRRTSLQSAQTDSVYRRAHGIRSI